MGGQEGGSLRDQAGWYAAAAAGGAEKGAAGAEEGDLAPGERAAQQGVDGAEDEFGQIGVGEHPGGAWQGVPHAETAGEGEDGDAEEAVAAAVGGGHPIGQRLQRAGGAAAGDEAEEAGPDARIGPAAVLAVQGIGAGRGAAEVAPGEGCGDGLEDGVQPGAGVFERAAGAGEGKVGGEGFPFGVGEGGPGAGVGHGGLLSY